MADKFSGDKGDDMAPDDNKKKKTIIDFVKK